MIIIPIILLLMMVFIRFNNGMFQTLIFIIATKSILDTFWYLKIGSFSILSIQGFLIPLLFLNLLSKVNSLPEYWVQNAKYYIFSLSFGLIWGFTHSTMNTIELILLNINIFLGFILFPLLVKSDKQVKYLLISIIISGIFPILVSLYQFKTGTVFNLRATVGLTRYVGFYHDAFPVRFYSLMTFFSILVYSNFFEVKTRWMRIIRIVIIGGSFFSLYLVFSKAGVSIIGVWFIILLLISKNRMRQGFAFLIGSLVLFLVFGDVFYSNLEQLFSKEIGYQVGKFEDVRYTLAGRGYIWEDYMDFWIKEQNLIFKLIGDGISRPTHNELLRILMVNGIFGVFFFLLFIIRNIRFSFRATDNNIIAFLVMLLSMYFIDAVGLTPGVYYYYNILVWGLFGLLILNPNLFMKETT